MTEDFKPPPSFGEIVAYHLGRLRLSDAAFAEAMNVSRPTVTRWRQGDAEPHPIMQPAILKALREWKT